MNVNKRIEVLSHSGASLEVVKDEDSLFSVIKEVDFDIVRAAISIKKQKKFKTINTGAYSIISVPIEKEVNNGNSISIKMPYVEGMGGEQFAVRGNKKIANNLKRTLNSYLIDLCAGSTIETIDEGEIEKKINDVLSKVKCEGIKKSVSLASTYLLNLKKDNLCFPISRCHGDLTLSNIIVSEDKMYIFDFLDSFIESPLQDAAKILQDMKYGWSFRKNKPSIKLKGEIFCKAAFPSFINELKKYYSNEMNLMEVLTILRIAPYINDDDEITKNWFNDSIEKFLNEVS